VAAGHEVSLWTLEGFPHRSPAIRLPPPVEMRVFRVEPPTKLGRSAEMRRQLRLAESPDIYHLHGVWLQAMHYGADEARRRNRPYVLELAGMYEPLGLRQKWFPKRVARWWFQDRILREAACLHVNSNQEAENIRRLGFKTPIAVIPVGVDVSKIGKAEILKPESGNQKSEIGNRKSEIESKLDGRPFILYLSRVHPKKGLDLLIRSWAAIQKAEDGAESRKQPGEAASQRLHGPEKADFSVSEFQLSAFENVRRPLSDWRLVIAGPGEQPYVDRCQRLATELGIARQCLWTGHVDEVQKSWLFSHAHCYVLPTSGENFGNTVAEALAHGTPVITTRHTPWKDLEEHGCGWFVDNTETEISRALHEAFSLNAIARGRMGDAGERLLRERYSLGAVLSDINAVYEWLSGGASVPACVELNPEDGRRRTDAMEHSTSNIQHPTSSDQMAEDGARTTEMVRRPLAPAATFQTNIEQVREVEFLFDQKAATWSKKYGMGGSLRPRLYAFEERLGELAQPPATVLDFGCGTGNLAGHLSACGYALSACDISSKMVEWARKSKHGTSAAWHVLPAAWRELPFASNTFDAIVASSVFEYLTSIDMTLAEFRRILKPGGFLIATVPNNRHFVRKLENFLRPIAATAVKMPVLNRIPRLNSYATYLHCSRNRMLLDEWFAIGNRARFEAVARDQSRASKAVLVFLVFRKADNS
jgi:glycosyltransferase involved in cell wall biosynthesis/ubiquinone/menaquinone biosynthesis C-methylase UbiE